MGVCGAKQGHKRNKRVQAFAGDRKRRSDGTGRQSFHGPPNSAVSSTLPKRDHLDTFSATRGSFRALGRARTTDSYRCRTYFSPYGRHGRAERVQNRHQTRAVGFILNTKGRRTTPCFMLRLSKWRVSSFLGRIAFLLGCRKPSLSRIAWEPQDASACSLLLSGRP